MNGALIEEILRHGRLRALFWDLFVFLVYINELAVGLKCYVKFADHTSLLTVVESFNTAANMI